MEGDYNSSFFGHDFIVVEIEGDDGWIKTVTRHHLLTQAQQSDSPVQYALQSAPPGDDVVSFNSTQPFWQQHWSKTLGL